MAPRGIYQNFSLGQGTKRTAGDSHDIDYITDLPGSAPEKKTRLNEDSHETVMQQLSRKTEALCLADAHREVLDTYELFELILLQLPIKDLFVLQRTCSKWQKIITESHALQKRMYLRPQAAVMRPLPDRSSTYYTEPVKVHPAICFLADHGSGKDQHTSEEYGPMIHSQYASFGEVYLPRTPRHTHVGFSLLQHCYKSRSLSASIGSYREEASWKQMLISDPPVPAIHANLGPRDWLIPERRDDYTGLEDVLVYNAAGVRFGDLVDMRRRVKHLLQLSGTSEEEVTMFAWLGLRDAEIIVVDHECDIQSDGENDKECRCMQRLESA